MCLIDFSWKLAENCGSLKFFLIPREFLKWGSFMFFKNSLQKHQEDQKFSEKFFAETEQVSSWNSLMKTSKVTAISEECSIPQKNFTNSCRKTQTGARSLFGCHFKSTLVIDQKKFYIGGPKSVKESFWQTIPIVKKIKSLNVPKFNCCLTHKNGEDLWCKINVSLKLNMLRT